MRSATDGWLATWAGGTVPTWPRWVSADRGFHDQTVRQMLFTTAGGDAVRIRISNRHGKAGLRIGRASAGVTRRPRAADLVPGTSRPVTFGGAASVMLPAGAEVTSDPVPFTVLPHQVIAIDLYLPERNQTPEYTANPIQAAYVAAGDRAGDDAAAGFGERVTAAYLEGAEGENYGPLTSYLVGLEVRNTEASGCIVVTGDSLTFGRWPQWLSRRLRAEFGDRAPSVVQVANSGQKLISDSSSAPNLVSRFDPDVLSVTGVSQVIVSIGFNDLAIPSPAELAPMMTGARSPHAPDGASTADMIACYEQLITKARQRGVGIFACTIPPGNGGAWNVGQYGGGTAGPDLLLELWPEKNETIRHEVNRWLREESEFDAVFDFASVLENRLDRAVQDPLYSDDGVHLNVGGWFEMAFAVDLKALNALRGSLPGAVDVAIRRHSRPGLLGWVRMVMRLSTSRSLARFVGAPVSVAASLPSRGEELGQLAGAPGRRG